MSQALPGEHLCKQHQGNHSLYATENCRICQLVDQLATAERRAATAEAECQRMTTELRDIQTLVNRMRLMFPRV